MFPVEATKPSRPSRQGARSLGEVIGVARGWYAWPRWVRGPRARRQTARTRSRFATLLAAVGSAAFAVGPRLVRGRHARPRVSAPPTPVTTAMTTTTPAEP